MNRSSDLWVYNKRYNLHVIKIPERNEKYYVAEKVFEEKRLTRLLPAMWVL